MVESRPKARVKIFPQKILSARAISLLQDFTTEGADLRAFRDAFAEWIAEIEVKRDFTAEDQALLGLELLLHEAGEGFRDIEEAYEYAEDLLEAERLARCESPVRLPNPAG
ncbi:MAG: hypothetical protein HY673_14765 [Chloroflexi bacterium]|nr:hypothetical protein [Chloroflexota bacterium]